MDNLYRSKLYKEFQAKREERRAVKLTYWFGGIALGYFALHLIAYLLVR